MPQIKVWRSKDEFNEHVHANYDYRYENNVMLVDLIDRLEQFATDTTQPEMYSIEKNEHLLATVLRTDPDHGFILSQLDPASFVKIEELTRKSKPPSLFGLQKDVEMLGKQIDFIDDKQIAMTLYVLTSPNLITNNKLQTRNASMDDFELLYNWMELFRKEAVPHEGPTSKTNLQTQIESKKFLLLENNGAVVSFAGWNHNLEAPKIAPVFTPIHLRGQGFAAVLTSELCRQIASKTTSNIALFADKSNASSNRLYQKLGFAARADYLQAFLR